jgi:hypothetical protein
VGVYLRPKDWEKKQSTKYTHPTWIRLHVGLLFNPEYMKLTPVQRAALHGFELIYALSGRTWQPLSVDLLNRSLGLNTKLTTWIALVERGFLETVERDPSASAAQEQEEKKEEDDCGGF